MADKLCLVQSGSLFVFDLFASQVSRASLGGGIRRRRRYGKVNEEVTYEK